MIKIGDSVIQKVEQYDNGVTTEIPVVAISTGNPPTGSLLHLGYNSYYTVFTDTTLHAASLASKGYATISRKQKDQDSYDSIPTRFLKAWMYLDKVPTLLDVGNGIEKSITIRFSFARGNYEYDTGKFASELSFKATLKFYPKSVDNITNVYCQRSCVWYRGNSVLTSYTEPESSTQIVNTTYRGMMIALGVNGHNLIPSGYCAFITTYGTSQGVITYGDSVPYGTLPLRPTNSDPRIAIYVAGSDAIQYRVEAASYKPADATSYDSDYCLHIDDNTNAQGKSNAGHLTWNPYITWATSGPPDKPSAGSGGVMPGTTQEMY